MYDKDPVMMALANAIRARMIADPNGWQADARRDLARPMSTLPPYARRFQAYRNPNVALVATKGWDKP